MIMKIVLFVTLPLVILLIVLRLRLYFVRKECDTLFCEKCNEVLSELKMVDPTPLTCAYYRHQLLRLKNLANNLTMRLFWQKVHSYFEHKFRHVHISKDEYVENVKQLIHAEKG